MLSLWAFEETAVRLIPWSSMDYLQFGELNCVFLSSWKTTLFLLISNITLVDMAI